MQVKLVKFSFKFPLWKTLEVKFRLYYSNKNCEIFLDKRIWEIDKNSRQIATDIEEK